MWNFLIVFLLCLITGSALLYGAVWLMQQNRAVWGAFCVALAMLFLSVGVFCLQQFYVSWSIRQMMHSHTLWPETKPRPATEIRYPDT